MATQPVELAEEVQDRDYESEARRQGWVPPEAFTGDPTKALDAKTFVERGENDKRLLRERDRVREQQFDTLKRDLKKTLVRLESSDKRAYERARADLEKQQADAVEMGDVAGVKKATADIVALERETVEAAAPEPKVSAEEVEAATIEWRAKNSWYDSDPVAQAYADKLAVQFAPKAKDMAPGDYFDMIGEMVVKAMRLDTDEDDEPKLRRPRLSAVEGATSRRTKGSHTFNDLPMDAQNQANRFVKMGVFKAKEEMLKSWKWD